MTSAPRHLVPAGGVLVAAVLSLLLLASPVAAAGPPQSGSGTGVVTGLDITSQRQAGNNSIQERTLTGTVTGTLEGVFVQHVRGVVHDGEFVTFAGTMTFTGTVAGCGEGTMTLALAGNGSAGAAPETVSSVRVIDQAANTLDVTGVGTVHQQGPFMSYEIRSVCR